MISKVRMFAEQKIDYMMLLNRVANDSEIEMSEDPYWLPEWEQIPGTRIVADYTDSLNSSIIKGLTDEIVGWIIYRRKKDEQVYHKVGEIDADRFFIIDHLVASDNTYAWTIVPKTETKIGISMESEMTYVDWEYWTVTAIKEIEPNVYLADRVWQLQMDVEAAALTQNRNVVVASTLSRYPKIVVGENNFMTQNITAKLGRINKFNGKLEDDIEGLQEWYEWIAQGGYAIIKDPKGHIFGAILTDSATSIDYRILDKPSTVQFSYTETFSVDDISVYEL